MDTNTISPASIARSVMPSTPTVVDLAAILAARSASAEVALQAAVAALAASSAAGLAATGSLSDSTGLDLYL